MSNRLVWVSWGLADDFMCAPHLIAEVDGKKSARPFCGVKPRYDMQECTDWELEGETKCQRCLKKFNKLVEELFVA